MILYAVAELIAMAFFILSEVEKVITNKTKEPRVYAAIFSIALLTFVSILNETAMNVTYPELVKVFGVSLDIVQWITTGYLLVVTIMMGTTAYLLRQFPAQRLHLLGVGLFVFGDIMGACAMNFPSLLIARLIQAMATGLSTPILFHLIFTQIPIEKKGMMTGFAGMVISFAPAIGPTYGGVVAELLSWRMIFWLILPVALISLVIGQLTIRSKPVGNDKPFSYLGLILLATALILVVYATSLIGKQGFSIAFWSWFLAGTMVFAIFLYVNNHGESRLLDFSIFRQVPLRFSAQTYFNLQFINIGISLVIPVYMQYVLHSSAMIAGLVLLPGSICGALIAPLAGRWADQQGFAKPVITGGSLLTIGGCLFVFLQNQLNMWTAMLFFLILRLGFNIAFSNTISNASMLVKVENSSDVNSIFNMIQQFAGSMGTGLLASIIALFQKSNVGSIAEQTFDGGRIDYIVILCLAVITLGATLINYRLQRKAQ